MVASVRLKGARRGWLKNGAELPVLKCYFGATSDHPVRLLNRLRPRFDELETGLYALGGSHFYGDTVDPNGVAFVTLSDFLIPVPPMMSYRFIRSTIVIAGFVITAEAGRAAEIALLPNVTMIASEVITLWPNGAPGETDQSGVEHVLTDRPRPFDQVTDVSVPTVSVFRAPAANRTGTAVLVAPGGGLERLALEHEGYEVAGWLNAHGIDAFLLKYRVPPRNPQQRWKVGVQDAQRAMGIIRSRAHEWQIDADAIGAIGFSAGAEINLILAVNDGTREYPPIDAADTFPSRPDFNIAMYGGGFADFQTNELRADIASGITKTTPPMFIAHAFDDQALSSVILMSALKRAGVVSELHIFGAGGHGFGVRDSGLPVGQWRELCLKWLRWQGFLDSADVRSYANEFLRARTLQRPEWPRFTARQSTDDLSSALAVQRRIVRHAVRQGDEIAGYKSRLAPASNANETGVLTHGVLMKSGRISATGTTVVPLSEQPAILFEAKIGYVIAVDIGSKLRVPRQAMTAVESVMPVVELPENLATRIKGEVGVVDEVAANLGSHQYIVGSAQPAPALNAVERPKVTVKREGKELLASANPDGPAHEAETLMTLINQVIDAGHVIHRGDVLLGPALLVYESDVRGKYEADFGTMGTILFRIK